jgi:hypothetical protein
MARQHAEGTRQALRHSVRQQRTTGWRSVLLAHARVGQASTSAAGLAATPASSCEDLCGTQDATGGSAEGVSGAGQRSALQRARPVTRAGAVLSFQI